MSATLSTPRARSRLARPLAFIGLAIVLALGALMAQAAISMAAAAGGANPAEPAAYVVAPALPPAAGPVATVRPVPTKVIRVSIARQELTAYENNTQVDSTALEVQVIDDPSDSRSVGDLARDWFAQFHSSDRILALEVNAYRELIEGVEATV